MHKWKGGGVPLGVPRYTFVVVGGVATWVQRVTVYRITIIGTLPSAPKWTRKLTVDMQDVAATIAHQKGALWLMQR